MTQSNAPETEQLLADARQGNHSALGQLIDEFRTYLALLARVQLHRYLQAKLDDSDLVQETCLQAHQGFGQFRGKTEAEFMHWLRKIMAHTAANMIRHYSQQKRDVRIEQQFERELDRSSISLGNIVAAPDSSPSQRVARRERAKIFADAIAALKDEYREIVILHHLEGNSMAEVAEKMGRTANSVQKLWARAIVQLRHILKDEVL